MRWGAKDANEKSNVQADAHIKGLLILNEMSEFG